MTFAAKVEALLDDLERAQNEHIETPEGETPFVRFEPTTHEEQLIRDLRDALFRKDTR